MGRCVQSEPLDLDALLLEVSGHDSGAYVVFSGTVRNENEGRAVRVMVYDAHIPLAEKVLADLEDDVIARFDVLGCRIQHRVGELQLGEPSVIIVVGAAHRAAAFEAAHYAIDTLKQRAPIWKEEQYADGESRFLDGAPLQAPEGR